MSEGGREGGRKKEDREWKKSRRVLIWESRCVNDINLFSD